MLTGIQAHSLFFFTHTQTHHIITSLRMIKHPTNPKTPEISRASDWMPNCAEKYHEKNSDFNEKNIDIAIL